jgi:hypothetical protein
VYRCYSVRFDVSTPLEITLFVDFVVLFLLTYQYIMSSSFPIISSPNMSYHINKKSVEDLYYDGLTDPETEYAKLSKLVNITKNRTLLDKYYNKDIMDREGFRHFVQVSSGIDGSVADEIFSCVTDLYTDESDADCLELPDTTMTKNEFVSAVVRLANLWYLMNEGMINTSQLAMQTTSFLSQVPA